VVVKSFLLEKSVWCRRELGRMGWTLYVEIDFFLSHLQIKSRCLLDGTAGLDGS
jgi:hypothetical protein